MTSGQLLFYGGIAGTVLFALLFAALWIVFEKKKKYMIEKIEQEL